MGLFNKSKDDSNAFIRKGEEAYYHQALTELESGKVNKGVYAKALAESSGDDAKTQSLYLKYRVQSIADEGAIEVLKQKEREEYEVSLPQGDSWLVKLWNFILITILVLVSLLIILVFLGEIITT
jgi:hypothetical protein